MNFGRTFVFLFRFLPLVLRVCGYGRRRSHKRWGERKLRYTPLGWRSICIRFVYSLFYLLSSLLYYNYTNTHPSPPYLWIIGHTDLSHNNTRHPINFVGQGFYLVVSTRHAIIYIPVIKRLAMSSWVRLYFGLHQKGTYIPCPIFFTINKHWLQS